MKAIVIDAFNTPGQLRDIPAPPLEPDSAVFRVTVAGVNPIDWKIRDGGLTKRSLPLVLGQDFAGVVERAGARVTRVKPGDRVVGCARDRGAYAEFT
ncbi:MAG: alcohol dehydrogenase catalytic domain-containing protein, partial [Vulcanimicrobiaceae bacterium]